MSTARSGKPIRIQSRACKSPQFHSKFIHGAIQTFKHSPHQRAVYSSDTHCNALFNSHAHTPGVPESAPWSNAIPSHPLPHRTRTRLLRAHGRCASRAWFTVISFACKQISREPGPPRERTPPSRQSKTTKPRTHALCSAVFAHDNLPVLVAPPSRTADQVRRSRAWSRPMMIATVWYGAAWERICEGMRGYAREGVCGRGGTLHESNQGLERRLGNWKESGWASARARCVSGFAENNAFLQHSQGFFRGRLLEQPSIVSAVHLIVQSAPPWIYSRSFLRDLKHIANVFWQRQHLRFMNTFQLCSLFCVFVPPFPSKEQFISPTCATSIMTSANLSVLWHLFLHRNGLCPFCLREQFCYTMHLTRSHGGTIVVQLSSTRWNRSRILEIAQICIVFTTIIIVT